MIDKKKNKLHAPDRWEKVFLENLVVFRSQYVTWSVSAVEKNVKKNLRYIKIVLLLIQKFHYKQKKTTFLAVLMEQKIISYSHFGNTVIHISSHKQ